MIKMVIKCLVNIWFYKLFIWISKSDITLWPNSAKTENKIEIGKFFFSEICHFSHSEDVWIRKKNQSWNENSGILQQLSIWIQRPAASCRVRLVFMTFHSLSPNEASAARQISTVQESKVMHSIQDSFLLNAHFHWCWSVSYSWLTKVMDHLSYWLFIVYFSSWQIGWQQDPFQLYIYSDAHQTELLSV